MRVRPHQGIWEGQPAAALFDARDDAGEIFKIDLMANARARRHHLEISEALLSPAEEGVALDIAQKFDFVVEGQRIGGAKLIHLDGVVNDQFDGKQRIDFVGIAAKTADGVAHRGEVHHGGDAGEILHQDAGGHEGNFAGNILRRGGRFGLPTSQRLNVVAMDGAIVFVAEKIFE